MSPSRSNSILSGVLTIPTMDTRVSFDQCLNMYIGFKALKDNPAFLPSNPRDKADLLKFIDGLEQVAEPFLKKYISGTPYSGDFGGSHDRSLYAVWDYVVRTNPPPPPGERPGILWRLTESKGVTNELSRALIMAVTCENLPEEQGRSEAKIDLEAAPNAWAVKLAQIEADGKMRS